MRKVAIVCAYRSPIGSFGGHLKEVNVADLGVQVLRTALEKSHISPDWIEEVVFGNVLSSGLGQNIARQIAIKTGLPDTTTAYCVNQVCGSGLQAVISATRSILLGEREVVVAGGIEVMSQAPFLSTTHRFGSKLGHQTLADSLLVDGLVDTFSGEHMGITAERVAQRCHITREEQDAFALASQEKALQALSSGRFDDEIVPISITHKKQTQIFKQDEYPRTTSLESLQNLHPAFQTDGTVTAGNASGINDGCALVVLMSEEKMKELNLTPLAYVTAYASSGIDPDYMGLGPIDACKQALSKSQLDIRDMDLVELNEAFAAQTIPVIRELGIPPERVNVNGGAIALGHPIGASGTRILVTLVHELHKRADRYGLCSLCIGGGQGIALIIENADRQA